MTTDSPSFEDTVPGQGFDAPAAPTAPIAPGGATPDGWRDNRPGHAVVFTGRGSEYFKIWVVNLALTIVTLGIYSAWAKVRRLRYFYGNTSIADSTLDFHGSPGAILRGRIIALVVLVGYSQSPRISLTLYAVMAALLVVGFPWLYWRSLRFRLGNTSYRGARFRFEGKLSNAYEVLLPPVVLFLAINVLAVLMGPRPGRIMTPDSVKHFLVDTGVLYLIGISVWPYYYYRLRAYQHNFACFGTTAFSYRGGCGPFYKLFGTLMLMGFTWGVVLGVVVAVYFAASKSPPATISSGRPVGLIVTVMISYSILLAIIPYAVMKVQNIVWNSTLLGGDRFSSELRFGKLFKVEVVNLLVTIVTIGLFRPFAAIRSARIKLDACRFEGDPNRFEAAEIQDGSAVGYELGELIGFDIAL